MIRVLETLKTRLPLEAKGVESTVRFVLSEGPSEISGAVTATFQIHVFSEPDGALQDVVEVEHNLVPQVDGLSDETATEYVEAWLDLTQRTLDDLGAAAINVCVLPLYGLLDYPEHPLRLGPNNRAAFGAMLRAIRARHLAALAADEALLDRLSAALEPSRAPLVRLYRNEPTTDSLTGSRLGGVPYWPESLEYPCDPNDGTPLRLAAQIDFSEVPVIAGFPTRGIFQLFVKDEPGHGVISAPTSQHGFRVHYHAEVDLAHARPRAWFDFVPTIRDLRAPGGVERSLSFERDSETMGISDHRFAGIVGEAGFALEELEGVESIRESAGTKLGGYPHRWSGDDVRARDEYVSESFELFLQLDTDADVVWGRDQTCKVYLQRATGGFDFSKALVDIS